jgi:hypothetical protein
MIIAKDTSTEKFPKLPLPEAGTTQAVCCGVWDLGLQKTTFKGAEKIKRKIVIAWEVTEKINSPESEYHDKPYMLSKTYTLSLYEGANLRKDLESWRGLPFSEADLQTGFDVEKLYGINCFLGIKHEPDHSDPSKVYANVTAILPLPKGSEKISPLRTREEPAPKWVLDKQAQAITEDEFSQVPETSDDPFAEPA